MARTGTHTLADLQAVQDTPIVKYGLENVLDVIQNELDAHNLMVGGLVADFATPTTEREEANGGATSTDMEEADEYSRPRTQKPAAPDKVGYPLRRFLVAMGWTAEFFNQASPARMAELLLEGQAAHLRQHVKAIRAALLAPTNYTFDPYIEDLNDLQVTVRALYNGDGFVPPMGPNLEIFAGTHNHYVGSATLTNAAIGALISNVAEHANNSQIRVYISKTDETAVRALTDFRPYLDIREKPRLDRDLATAALDIGSTDNRPIGIIQGAEIWTKPWMPQNYALAVNINAPAKALRMREPVPTSRRGLRPIAEIATFPLQANLFEALFGYGAFNRSAAAALQFNNATYSAPTGL